MTTTVFGSERDAGFGTPDRLAGLGGIAPAPRDFGKISGNPKCSHRYNRRLQHVFYASALFSIYIPLRAIIRAPTDSSVPTT